MTDISSFVSSFLDSFISVISSIYTYLSNIQFFGFSLLSYIISLFVLSVAVPIVVSLVSGGYSSARSSYRSSRSRSERSLGGSDE